MTASRRTVIFSVTVAFIAAQLIVVLLHELSHVVAGFALGYGNELYPFGVTHHPDPDTADAAIAALTGPAFSLVIGVLALAIQPFRRRAGFAHLLWIWVAFTSVMEGVGYLVLTPFGVGDTGTTAESLGAPVVVSLACFAVGALGYVLLARAFASVALRHTSGDLDALRCFTFYPWIFGTLVMLALCGANLLIAGSNFSGGEIFAVLMGTFALGVFSPMAMPFTTGARKRQPESVASEPLTLPRVPVTGIVIAVIIVAVNLLVLSTGLSIG
ncbi:hypothetical protein [Microbacterium sp. MPKO10]|uniref:hypothetical protein n=1 Tax=Microbacterium sp. MPKO10 TaxID=2989818 RepID=UPI00223673BF|nr:hypothetical protein [Microbacterium sp. MPKO10]MCW4456651.1 hypothetical protein [Microbacterium sp. MPKO10]